MPITHCRTADEVAALPRGTAFSIPLPAGMSWKDRHRVLYYTANREVRIRLKGKRVVGGTLAETPGYFSRGTKAGANLWLRVPGRKTRLRVPAEDIRLIRGFRAPTLAEALTAFIYLTSSNPSADQVAESRETARMM